MKSNETERPPILAKTEADFENPLAIEMRRLYTKLRPRLRRDDLSVLMVTSAERGEGKSTTSSNLAATIARHKRTKTILVDADMRRPTIHKILGIDREKGLSDLLSGKAKLTEVVRKTQHEHLEVITCGMRVSSPSGFFESRALTRLVAELRQEYDMIIFDAPPVLPVADSQILGQEVDGTLLVVMAGMTPREVVLRAQQVLQDGRANVLGAILNNAAEVLPYYYSYNYYGYE